MNALFYYSFAIQLPPPEDPPLLALCRYHIQRQVQRLKEAEAAEWERLVRLL